MINAMLNCSAHAAADPGPGTGIGMSQQNVEIAKQATGAFNRRDIDAFARVTTADFEWVPVFAARVGGGPYIGREGIDRSLAEVGETWEEFTPVPEEYRDLGETVVGLGRLKTRGRGSGVPVESSWGGVFDFRDGRIARIRTFLDHDEALRAAGRAG